MLPWVDSGRRPHAGDPVTAHDLRRLLLATKEGGARHFLYHNHGHLTAAEWSVDLRVLWHRLARRAGDLRPVPPPDG